MTKKYRHIFFDLDHTLWDYEKNAAITLNDIFTNYQLAKYGITANDFVNVCSKFNQQAWDLYRKNIIDRNTLRKKRFEDTFAHFGIPASEYPSDLPELFLQKCPENTHLISGTIDLLEYLRPNYTLHIITNGFEESQYRKLQNCGIRKYFSTVTTGDIANAKKPEPEIFHYALNSANAEIQASIMIGDEVDFDIAGAQNIGMEQIHYNPEKILTTHVVPTYSVSSLSEIIGIL